jgi:lipid-A-disaccharide synthase
MLPGSRPGEIARHLPILFETSRWKRRDLNIVAATPTGFTHLTEPLSTEYIQHIAGETWDALTAADVALAASGTVTIEAAILGAPLATFYRVSPWSWWMGRYLVQVPFYSMVNLVAGRAVVPELIQDQLTPDALAGEALRLLDDREARLTMQMGLQEVTRKLSSDNDPIESAARIVLDILEKDSVHV